MKSYLTRRVLVATLSILVLFVVQTFGSRAGYVCRCAGEPVPTKTSHCHGPHGEDCHADEGKDAEPHEEQGSGPREDHQVVKQDVPLRAAEAVPQLIAPQALVAVLPLAEILFAGQEEKIPCSYSVDFGESPPFGVTVARTIVLLI